MSEQASRSNRRALTEAAVRDATLPPSKQRDIVWDGTVTGFGLRVLASGSKSFVFVGRPRGMGRAAPSRTLTIGAWPTLSVIAARKVALGYAGQMARGLDPVAERHEQKRKARASVGALLAEGGVYQVHLEQRHLVNRRAALSVLRRGLKALMARDVDNLTRQDVVAAISVIASSGKRGAARDLRKHANGFYEWAVSAGFAKANPLAGWRAPKRTRQQRLADEENKRRGRMLTDMDIRAVWHAAANLGAFGGLVRAALLTGMRRGELAGLDRSINFIVAERITLPPSVTKTGEAHEVPITPLLRAVLAEQPKVTSGLVFPATNGGRIVAWSQRVRQLRRASGVAFTMHDLRRTCRSLMDRLGVKEDIGELAIGHVRVGLLKIYNLNEAWALRVEAFERVAAHISAVSGAPDNVVPLTARRA